MERKGKPLHKNIRSPFSKLRPFFPISNATPLSAAVGGQAKPAVIFGLHHLGNWFPFSNATPLSAVMDGQPRASSF